MPLSTYNDARQSLDGLLRDMERKLHTRMDQAEAEMRQALQGLETDKLTREGSIAQAIREAIEGAGQNAMHAAHALGVADLLRSMLPRKSSFGPDSKTGVVSTRSPVTPAGKMKPFPSDSPTWRAKTYAPGGHRRYIRRGPPIRLPKGYGEPALRKRGRPRVPQELQLENRKAYSRTRLAKQRAKTAKKRKEKEWKPYPWPRKRKGKGYSVAKDSAESGKRSSAMRREAQRKAKTLREQIRERAREFIEKLAEEAVSKWTEAHLPWAEKK